MAKRQNFVVGSTNAITAQKTDNELNTAWNRLDVLNAEDLDGVFYSVSDYSKDSSQEIANAIQTISGSQPTGATQSELGNALSTKFGTCVKYSDIVDNTSSTATDKALSANMGKTLQDEISNLQARGRFLAIWNSATGLPETNPQTSPYTYKTGDYYVVGTTGTTNYKPNGSTYTRGVASITVETEAVQVDDTYMYDGTNWRLQQTQAYTNVVHITGAETVTGNKTFSGDLIATTQETSDDSTKVATTAFVRSILPAGVIVPYGGSSAPDGWLLCNGDAISRTTYSGLFNAIGTTYGAGDGSTTFNLPSLGNGRVPLGTTGDIGGSTDGFLPNITGTFNPNTHGDYQLSGAFYNTNTPATWYYEGGDWHSANSGRVFGIDASLSSSVYTDNQTTVVPSGVYMRYIIKC